MKLVSDEVFENIVNRLNLLESKVINFNNQNEIFVKNFSTIQSSVDNLNTKLSSFINETNERFTDYENALAEIEQNLEEKLQYYGNELRDDLNLDISEMDASASKFFKFVYQNTPRVIGR